MEELRATTTLARSLSAEIVPTLCEDLQLELLAMPAAKGLCDLLSNVTSGPQLAAALRASGDMLAGDADRALTALRSWRLPVEAELSRITPEAGKKQVLADIRALLEHAPASFDWLELGSMPGCVRHPSPTSFP